MRKGGRAFKTGSHVQIPELFLKLGIPDFER